MRGKRVRRLTFFNVCESRTKRTTDEVSCIFAIIFPTRERMPANGRNIFLIIKFWLSSKSGETNV